MYRKKTTVIVYSAMLAALSTALMFLEFQLPLLPPFLKLDFSDIPALIGAFVLGPLPALAITFIKDLIHASISWSGGVGELADFLVTGSFVLVAGAIYRAKKTTGFAVLGSLCGILIMTLVGAVSNLWLILPFYEKLMPIKAILSMCAKVNPVITDVRSYILFGVIPFNLIKGVIISAVTFPVYKRLETYLARSGKSCS